MRGRARLHLNGSCLYVITLFLALGLGACSQAVELDEAVISHHSYSRPWAQLERVSREEMADDPEELGADAGEDEVAALLARVRSAEPAQLDRIESVMNDMGELFILLDVYRTAASERPLEFRPRLSWLLARLGRLDEAIFVAEQAVEAAPTHADAWFALGFAWGQHPATVGGVVGRAVSAFERVLELEPDYLGPAGASAEQLRQDIAAARQQVAGQ